MQIKVDTALGPHLVRGGGVIAIFIENDLVEGKIERAKGADSRLCLVAGAPIGKANAGRQGLGADQIVGGKGLLKLCLALLDGLSKPGLFGLDLYQLICALNLLDLEQIAVGSVVHQRAPLGEQRAPPACSQGDRPLTVFDKTLARYYLVTNQLNLVSAEKSLKSTSRDWGRHSF